MHGLSIILASFALGVVIQIISHGVRVGIGSLEGGSRSPVVADGRISVGAIVARSADGLRESRVGSLPRKMEHSKLVLNNQPILSLGNCARLHKK